MRKSKLPGFTGSFDFGILPKSKYFNTRIFFEKNNETTSFDQEAYAKGVPGSQGILIETLCKLEEE